MIKSVEEISWTFYGYETPAGGKDVQDWFDGLEDVERDEAKDTIGYLQTLPFKQWEKPEYFPLSDGLSEIRFKVNQLNRVYRIYGFFWPAGRSYTFLLGAFKKVKNPTHDIKEARKRKKRLENKQTTCHEFKF